LSAGVVVRFVVVVVVVVERAVLTPLPPLQQQQLPFSSSRQYILYCTGWRRSSPSTMFVVL
jgi:hypothetical protein